MTGPASFDAIPAGDPMAPWCDLCGLEHSGPCPDDQDEDNS